MSIANDYYQQARNAYSAGDFQRACDEAITAINQTITTPQQFVMWLNPSFAVEFNNRGDWISGWNASYEAINPQVTDSMILFMKSCQIYLKASITLGDSQRAIAFTMEFLGFFTKDSTQQRVDRVFTQLEFARQTMIFTGGEDPAVTYNCNIMEQKKQVEDALKALNELADIAGLSLNSGDAEFHSDDSEIDLHLPGRSVLVSGNLPPITNKSFETATKAFANLTA